jgi:hypothetical protein
MSDSSQPEIISAKLVTFSDDSQKIIAIGRDSEMKNYKISAKLENSKVIKPIVMEETSETGKEEGYGVIFVNPDDLVYVEVNLSSLSENQNFLIVQDFIQEHL